MDLLPPTWPFGLMAVGDTRKGLMEGDLKGLKMEGAKALKPFSREPLEPAMFGAPSPSFLHTQMGSGWVSGESHKFGESSNIYG